MREAPPGRGVRGVLPPALGTSPISVVFCTIGAARRTHYFLYLDSPYKTVAEKEKREHRKLN